MRLVCIALASLLAAAPAGPEFSDPRAKEHFDQAGELYASEDFAGASEQLRQAYELEPIPTLLYSRAQVERMLEHWSAAAELYEAYLHTEVPEEKKVHARRHGLFCRAQAARLEDECEQAIELYDEYIEAYPETPQAEESRAGKEVCARVLAEPEPAPEPEPEPQPPPAVVVAPLPTDDAAKRGEPGPWYTSVAGGVLAGVGVAGLATGGVLTGLAYRDERLAADEPTHDGSALRYERARQREIAGTVTLALAGASLVFAGLAYGLSARRSRASSIAARPGGFEVRF